MWRVRGLLHKLSPARYIAFAIAIAIAIANFPVDSCRLFTFNTWPMHSIEKDFRTRVLRPLIGSVLLTVAEEPKSKRSANYAA